MVFAFFMAGCARCHHHGSVGMAVADHSVIARNARVDDERVFFRTITPMNRYAWFISLLLSSVMIMGVGCIKPAPSETSNAGAKSSLPFAELSAKEAAARVTFSEKDTFEVRQTFFGFGAFLPDLTGSTQGVRSVTVTRFAPRETAAVKWMTVEERETEASKKARADYDRLISQKTYAIGEKMPMPPEPQMEKETAEGALTDLNLRSSHALFPPVYWLPGETIIKSDQSGIWLSDEAFEELRQTRQTVLSFGVLDATANKISQNISQLRSAWDRLRHQAQEDGKGKERTVLKADPEFLDWTLKVNGQDATVSAIRAKNWFGEIVVLNNRQNPLILKMTLNPMLAGASIFNKQEGWSHIFGFEITNVVVRSSS